MEEQLSTQGRIGLNHDPELNQAKDTRRVEWLTVLLLVGLFTALFAAFALRFVRQAWSTADQTSARVARVAVQVAVDLANPAPDAAFDYQLGVQPAEDDENGALVRAALAGSAPTVSGAHYSRRNMAGTADKLLQGLDQPDGSLAPLVFSASQQNGVFTLCYWRSQSSWLKHPDQPDCTWVSIGPAAQNLAGAAGQFK